MTKLSIKYTDVSNSQISLKAISKNNPGLTLGKFQEFLKDLFFQALQILQYDDCPDVTIWITYKSPYSNQNRIAYFNSKESTVDRHF